MARLIDATEPVDTKAWRRARPLGNPFIGDLGIRSAVQRLYRLDHLPTPREVDAIGEKWRPNRSLASLYLWASTRPAVKPAKQSPRKKRTASR